MASRDDNDLEPQTRLRYRILRSRHARTHPSGPTLILVSVYRSLEEQAAIWAKGRTVPGPGVSPQLPLGRVVTHARPGQSLHNYRPVCCLDWGLVDKQTGRYIADPTEQQLREVGEIAEASGFEWGWRWPGAKRDGFHLQAPHYRWQDAADGLPPFYPPLPDWARAVAFDADDNLRPVAQMRSGPEPDTHSYG